MRVPGIPFIQGRNRYTDADGTKYGIAIHNTANNATASGEASYAQRRSDTVSSHFYVDDREVIQSLDTKDRAGHAASRNGNENAIAVEITGTNDKSRSWWLNNVAWDELGRVLAYCCREYGIKVRRASVTEMKSNPKVRAFYSHNDMRLAWGGTTHTDPGPNFPWDRLFEAVNAALNPQEDDDMPLTPDDVANVANAVAKVINTRFGLPVDANAWKAVTDLKTDVGAVRNSVAALVGADLVNEEEIADRVLAGIGKRPVNEIKDALRAALPPDTYAQLFPQG